MAVSLYLLYLLILLLVLTIYFKLIVPGLYWRRRNIFYLKPWNRMREMFLTKRSFAEGITATYNQFPDRRYFGSYQFLQPSLFIRDLDLIKKITVKDFDHFTDHMTFDIPDQIIGQNLFSLRGKKWRDMRSTLSPAFTSSKMRTMYTLIQQSADRFTGYFVDHNQSETEALDVKNLYAKFTNDVIANCAFGIECNSLESDNEFFKMGIYFSETPPARIIRSVLFGFFPKLFQWFKIPLVPNYITDFFLTLIRDTIKTREDNNIVRPDMIHLLMEARKGQLKNTSSSDNEGFATVTESTSATSEPSKIEMTDELITAQALVFFIAGFTTSSGLLSFMSYELAVHPEIQAKLQDEIDRAMAKHKGVVPYEEISNLKYLDQVVSESLRKYPPAYVLNRICVKDYKIPAEQANESDFVVEKNCLVAIPAMAIHYSEEYFKDPTRFDPERFSDGNKSKIVNGTYMPFGLGPRNCIGSRFALLQMKALMISLLHKFDLVPVKETRIPLKFAKSLSLEAEGGVWLGLKRRDRRE